WRTHVDAHTGDIVLRHDLIDHAYSGRTEGDVEEFSYCDGMTPELPFAHMWVDITGVGVATSDSNGDFSIGGDIGPASYMAAFDGPDFDVECIGCANATLSGVIQPGVPASLYFDDAVARPDERDSFHFANRTEDFIRSIDPTFDLPKYSIEVNYDATCNATHNWSARRLRFYREGGGCANTGRIGGVVAHEFGHGVQGELMGGGDQAEQGLGEGNSDISATFITDDPVIGRGFYLDQCDGGLTGRNCDNDLIYPDDVIGQAIHSAGRVICGFNWDLRVLLEAKMGAAAGKAYTAYLWHFSRKLFGSPSMTQPDQVMAYLTVDDDDGDLTNGTPNWAEIYEAAEHHGFGSFFPPNPNRIDIVHQPLVDRDDPTGPYVVEADIQVFVAGVAEAPGATELHYALDGGAYANVPLVAAGGTTYLGEIPEQPAGTTITYYLRVDHPSGLEAYHPEDAPSDYHMFGVGPFTLVADHQMEVEEGWTVGAPSDSVEDGEWERADPVGIEFPAGSGVIYQTEDDHTAAPGVQCWVTENPPPGSFPWIDELDGRTSINSPVFDLSTATMVKGSVWYHAYFSNGNPPTGDYLDVKMTTDGGTTWTILAHLTDATTDWTELTFRLSPIDFDFTSQVQFRFTAEDVEPNGVTEAEIDDFHLEVLEGGAAAVEGPAAGAAPLALRLEPPSPNPFNPATAIRFSLPERGTVHLAIYDVGGRLVRGLVDGPREAGHHAVRWDGRDAGGGAAASGVYYARLVVGDRSATRTLVLVK
ncbi:MAG: FlgD immunoglobulin-like domain containing protein, partial [Candidatus Eiseniibacteriota bacterium]